MILTNNCGRDTDTFLNRKQEKLKSIYTVFLKTPGDIVMTKNQEDERGQLNKAEESPSINRGFELMLRHRSRREEPKPKTFGIMFGKVISLLKREIHFHFEIELSVIKKR